MGEGVAGRMLLGLVGGRVPLICRVLVIESFGGISAAIAVDDSRISDIGPGRDGAYLGLNAKEEIPLTGFVPLVIEVIMESFITPYCSIKGLEASL